MAEYEGLNDAGVSLWGGTIDEGLSRTTTFCPGYNIVSGYLDKRVGTRLKREIEDHLASCRECRWDIQELRQCLKDIA